MEQYRYDSVLVDIVRYVMKHQEFSSEAVETARLTLLDTIGCGLLALNFKDCTKLLGPIVPGITVPNGVHVPGTQFVLDPIQGAFNISCMNRWLDYNDTFLSKEWGHPSDNIGAILAVAEYMSNCRMAEGSSPIPMRDVVNMLIKAYEIQGVFSLGNSFNSVGLDHVLLVKVASAAVSAALLGGDTETILSCVSQAWVDGQCLRTYRHWPNTGSRKSWAGGDAAARGVYLSLLSMRGEKGYSSVLTAPTWGFYDVLFKGKKFVLPIPFGEYTIKNILFKASYPAEFHAQTAIEASIKLHPAVSNRIQDIKRILIKTHLSALRIIDKKGVLNNEADRDHCMQYMVAVALIFGDLKAEHYQNDVAADPRIDVLREKMVLQEVEEYSRSYLDPNERSIANCVQVEFNDGTQTNEVEIMYPLGHRRRRKETIPLIREKFMNNLQARFSKDQANVIFGACFESELSTFLEMSVVDFIKLFTN